MKIDIGEDGGAGLEVDFGAGLVGIADRPQRRLNGYVGWESEDMRWRATLSAQNLTDRADWVGGFYIPNIFGADQASRNVLPPRMWMAEISYRY